MNFGEYMRQLRKAKGYSTAELANKLGTMSSYVSHVESGKSTIGPKALRKLANALDCSFIGLMIRAGHITEAEALGWIEEQREKEGGHDQEF